MSNYNSKEDYKQLKLMFEGKTVKKVIPGDGECLATFEMTDGTSFKLSCTDLGFWIEKNKKQKKG